MAFTATLTSLISDVSTTLTFFIDTFVRVADMFFNSPFVIFIGLGIVTMILGIVSVFLRIKRGS